MSGLWTVSHCKHKNKAEFVFSLFSVQPANHNTGRQIRHRKTLQHESISPVTVQTDDEVAACLWLIQNWTRFHSIEDPPVRTWNRLTPASLRIMALPYKTSAWAALHILWHLRTTSYRPAVSYQSFIYWTLQCKDHRRCNFSSWPSVWICSRPVDLE